LPDRAWRGDSRRWATRRSGSQMRVSTCARASRSSAMRHTRSIARRPGREPCSSIARPSCRYWRW
jgi:hypothetical protein